MRSSAICWSQSELQTPFSPVSLVIPHLSDSSCDFRINKRSNRQTRGCSTCCAAADKRWCDVAASSLWKSRRLFPAIKTQQIFGCSCEYHHSTKSIRIIIYLFVNLIRNAARWAFKLPRMNEILISILCIYIRDVELNEARGGGAPLLFQSRKSHTRQKKLFHLSDTLEN